MEKKPNEVDNSGINLSADALKQLLLTVLEEAKKPAPPTQSELAAIAQKNEERASNAAGAKVLLVGMVAPPNWGEEYKTAFDRIFPELAKVHDVPLYPFFLEGVAMKPEFNQPDGLHPNERGVAVLVERLAPVVARLVWGPS